MPRRIPPCLCQRLAVMLAFGAFELVFSAVFDPRGITRRIITKINKNKKRNKESRIVIVAKRSCETEKFGKKENKITGKKGIDSTRNTLPTLSKKSIDSRVGLSP
ncbi:hypothetical protein VZO05_00450 [Aggregatilineales bacterium SYSU G02658]